MPQKTQYTFMFLASAPNETVCVSRMFIWSCLFRTDLRLFLQFQKLVSYRPWKSAPSDVTKVSNTALSGHAGLRLPRAWDAAQESALYNVTHFAIFSWTCFWLCTCGICHVFWLFWVLCSFSFLSDWMSVIHQFCILGWEKMDSRSAPGSLKHTGSEVIAFGPDRLTWT